MPGEVACQRRPKLIEGLGEGRLTAASSLLQGPLAVVYLVPILLNDELRGVLDPGLTATPSKEQTQPVQLACVHLAIAMAVIGMAASFAVTTGRAAPA